jgi:hypothetical protein
VGATSVAPHDEREPRFWGRAERRVPGHLSKPVETEANTVTEAQPTPDRFAEQLARLGQKHPQWAQAIATAATSNITVELSHDGSPTASVLVGDASIALHSRYDPRREAERFAQANITNPATSCAVVGFGLGYHAEAILSRLCESAMLLIFEDRKDVMRAALEHRDLRQLLGSPRVVWFGDESRPEMLGRILPLADKLAEGLTVLATPATARRAPQYVERIGRLLDEIRSYGEMSLANQLTQNRRGLENIITNLVRYASAESLAHWKDRFRGYPAIVVSAGPSLMRNRHLLPRAVGRALVVCVGTAYKQLLGLGMQPDVVVHIDPSDLCLRHFQDVPDPGRTILLGEPAGAPSVYCAWTGRLAMIGHRLADHLLGRLARPLPMLPQGTTVAHTAFYFAEFCGADPMILVGQDLAFTDNLYYSAGNGLHQLWQPELNRFHSIESKEWERLVRRKSQLLNVPGWSGASLLTDRQMLHYLRQFERDFARCKAAVIDATEGGSAKAGARPMRLHEALERLLREPFDQVHIATVAGSPPSIAEIHRAIELACQRLRAFRQTAQHIVEVHRDATDKLVRAESADQCLNEISQLQRHVQDQFLGEYQLASTFNGSLEWKKRRQTRTIDTSGVTGAEKTNQLIQRDREYVAGLADAAEEVARRLERLLTASPASRKNQAGDPSPS